MNMFSSCRQLSPGTDANAIGSEAARAGLEAVVATAASGAPRHAAAALATLAEAVETTANPFGLAANASLAVSLYERAAELGSPSAQFALASLHLAGLFGTERDVPRAVTLLYFAAAAGSVEAQAALGAMHRDGRHTPQSCSSALAYLMPAGVRAAAEFWPRMQVLAPEQYRLDEESLVDPSRVKAILQGQVQFVRNKADKMDASAQLKLAWIAYSGRLGGQRDVPAALRLWEEAALQEAAPAMAALGHLHAEGVLDAEEALRRRDAALLQRAQPGPHPSSSAAPAPAPAGPGGSAGSEADAEPLLEAAVESGSPAAATTLAVLLLRRHGLLPRPDTAAMLLATDEPSPFSPAAAMSLRALRLEHSDPGQDSAALPAPAVGQTGVARMHDSPASASSSSSAGPPDSGGARRLLSSPALRRDVSRAVALLRTGVDAGLPQALYAAALLRLQGLPDWLSASKGLPRDFGKARSQLASAARRGFLPALLVLARLEAHGIGGERSCPQAAAHLTALLRLGRGQQDLGAAQRRLEAGDAAGAVFAWTRAAAMGLETASWNLGLIADRLLAEERSRAAVHRWERATSQRGAGGEGGGDAGAQLTPLQRALLAVDSSLRLAARRLFEAGSPASALTGPTVPAAPQSAGGQPPERETDAPGSASGGLWTRLVAGRARARRAMAGPLDAAPPAASAPVPGPPVAAEPSEAAEVGPDGSVGEPAEAAEAGPDGLAAELAGARGGVSGVLAAVVRSAPPRHSGLRIALGAGTARVLSAGELLPRMPRSPEALSGALQGLALRMFAAAAASGTDTDAMLMLGEYTRQGHDGAGGRPEAAVPFLREAAERRDARALWTLAHMHEMGEGLPLDWHLAKRLYDDAEGAAHEAAGPAWFGRARLWLKTRIRAALPAGLMERALPAIEAVLGPIPEGAAAAAGGGAGGGSTWPVSAWEQMPAVDEPGTDESQGAANAEQTNPEAEEERGQEEDDEEMEPEAAAGNAATTALEAIRARRRRAAGHGDLQVLTTHAALRAVGVPSRVAELADLLSGSDIEIAVILFLLSVLVLVIMLQVAGVRCC